MPLINGVKMACEPCIRGHRSTKCTHSNERLMVPVRKPGRPLSSCPHPASRPCTCAAVMAAIPRSQKCPCGTAEEASNRKTADRETSNGLVTPPSPAPKGTATTPAYRVQKASSKNGSGKKQIDPAGLERMDASQLNILSSPELKSPLSPTNGTMPTTPTTSTTFPGYGMMGFLPNGGSFNPNLAMFPVYQQLASANPMAGHTVSKLTAQNNFPPLMNEQGTALTARSCCGNGKSTGAPANEQHEPKANGTNGAENQPKSCCSSGGEKSETKPHERTPAAEMGPQANSIMMPHFNSVPVGMPNGVYPYFAQPAIFAYPPSYGSYMQPLQPDQWRQLMTALSFGQPATNVPQNIPYNTTAPPQFQQSNTLEEDSSWTAHHCGCGDTCQCIGCATHPYNQATQNYVRSAWNSMKEDAPKRHRHSDSTHSIPNSNHETPTPTPSNQSPNSGSTPVMTKLEGTASPVTAQTPSDANSTLGEELTLSANDFFFVSYPFGDVCEGEMANCPCGDGCQCIGCAIHMGSIQQGVET